MIKEIKPKAILLDSFEIVYSKHVSYGKDKTNVSVTVTLNIDGERFTQTKHMWQFEVSRFLAQFGAEI